MTLEELITQAAARGLTHLTLYPEQSSDGKKTYWAARATPSTGHHFVAAADMDPVKALTTVLDNLPKAPKRVTAAVKKFDEENPPLSEMPQRTSASAAAKLDSELENWLPKA